jgi:hypothetical protein
VKARALRRELVTGLIAPVQTTRLTGGYDFKNIFLFCYRNLMAFAVISNRQTAGRLAIKICDSIKHMWALPTPTTFEKVDQTFNFGTENFIFALLCCPIKNRLNHYLQCYPNI